MHKPKINNLISYDDIAGYTILVAENNNSDDIINILNRIYFNGDYNVLFSKIIKNKSDDEIKRFISKLNKNSDKKVFLEILVNENKTWAMVELSNILCGYDILSNSKNNQYQMKVDLLIRASELGDKSAILELSKEIIKSPSLFTGSYRDKTINNIVENSDLSEIINLLNNCNYGGDYSDLFPIIAKNRSDDEIKEFISGLSHNSCKKIFLEILVDEGKSWAMIDLAKILSSSDHEQLYTIVDLLTRSIKSGNNQAMDELSKIIQRIPSNLPDNKKEELLLKSSDLGCWRAEIELFNYYNNRKNYRESALQLANKITSRFLNGFDLSKADNFEFNVFLSLVELYYCVNDLKKSGQLLEYAIDLFQHAGRDIFEKINESSYNYTMELIIGDSLYDLGEYYADDKSKEYSIDKSTKYYMIAAEFGNSDAQAALGICYFNGLGVPKNETKVRYWLSKAIEDDNIIALDFIEKHPEFKENGVKNISYNANCDIIQGSVGILAKDDAIVNRANISTDNDDSILNNVNQNLSKSDFKFCIYCGEKLPANARFCMKCGEKLE